VVTSSRWCSAAIGFYLIDWLESVEVSLEMERGSSASSKISVSPLAPCLRVDIDPTAPKPTWSSCLPITPLFLCLYIIFIINQKYIIKNTMVMVMIISDDDDDDDDDDDVRDDGDHDYIKKKTTRKVEQ
jgi:hypothetical protein